MKLCCLLSAATGSELERAELGGLPADEPDVLQRHRRHAGGTLSRDFVR
jgi:hypothetical protein